MQKEDFYGKFDEEIDNRAVIENIEISVAHPVDDGKDDDADRHHQKQEGGAAAVMNARARLRVFGRELHPFFKTGDGLVLGAVVHEHAADVLHRGDEHDVQDEDDQADAALGEVVADRPPQPFGEDQVGKPQRQRDEQPHRQHDAQQRRQKGHRRHHVDVQLFLAPFFELRRLALVAVHFGAAHQDLRSAHQRRDEVDHPAHEGDLRHDAHPLRGVEPAALDLDVALGVAHGGGVRRFAAHHHPFEHGLAADVGALFLFRLFLFFFLFTHENDRPERRIRISPRPAGAE